MNPAPTLILASRSPRRRELLARWGVPHDVIPAAVDDSHLLPGRVTPAQWAVSLAHLKARAALDALPAPLAPDSILLGADTVIDKAGALVGTPVDERDARRILRLLSGGRHTVITGLALLHPGGTRTLACDAALVTLGPLTDCMIDAYLALNTWHGKAGAYNLAERQADGWPISVSGDPTTVMGLPMRTLARLLGLPHPATPPLPDATPMPHTHHPQPA